MPRFEEYDDILDVQEAMEILKISSRNTMYKLLKDGDIKAYQQGRNWRVPKQAVREYVEKRSGISIA